MNADNLGPGEERLVRSSCAFWLSLVFALPLIISGIVLCLKQTAREVMNWQVFAVGLAILFIGLLAQYRIVRWLFSKDVKVAKVAPGRYYIDL